MKGFGWLLALGGGLVLVLVVMSRRKTVVVQQSTSPWAAAGTGVGSALAAFFKSKNAAPTAPAWGSYGYAYGGTSYPPLGGDSASPTGGYWPATHPVAEGYAPQASAAYGQEVHAGQSADTALAGTGGNFDPTSGMVERISWTDDGQVQRTMVPA